jgi:hypothetical protein
VGTPNGTGQSTDDSVNTSPTIWDPARTEESSVDGQSTSGESETVGQGQGPTAASGARVPVSEVITDYQETAVEALDQGEIPPSQAEIVQDYFDTIAGYGD